MKFKLRALNKIYYNLYFKLNNLFGSLFHLHLNKCKEQDTLFILPSLTEH